MSAKLPHWSFANASLTGQCKLWLKALQEKRQEVGIEACIATFASLSATLLFCLLIFRMEQFIPCVTSANSARTGRSDQWPGLCRSEAVLAVLASTSLSVIKLALCKLSALASFAPKSRAFASACSGSIACCIPTWKKEPEQRLWLGVVRMKILVVGSRLLHTYRCITENIGALLNLHRCI